MKNIRQIFQQFCRISFCIFCLSSCQSGSNNSPASQSSEAFSPRAKVIGSALPNATAWGDSNLRIESALEEGKMELYLVGTLANSCMNFSHAELTQSTPNEIRLKAYIQRRTKKMCLMYIKALRLKLELHEWVKPGNPTKILIWSNGETYSENLVNIPN